MKFKTAGLFLSLLMIGGCAASRYRTAETYVKQEKYEQAIREYVKLLDPHIRNGKKFIFYDREAVCGIGEVYWQMKSFDTAERIFRMALEKDPLYGKAQYYLGLSLEGMAREDDAIRAYNQYPMLDSSDPYRRVMLGRADFLVRRKVAREVRQALQEENQITGDQLPQNSIAVLYFLSLSEDPQWQPLQKGLADMLITDLSQIDELTVVERLRLQQLMEELRLGATGLMEESTVPRLGKLLGARTLIKGSYMIMPDLKMTMDTGIFQSENVLLPADINFEGDITRLFRMEKELVLRIIDHFRIELSPQQRAAILKIPTQNMMAFITYCRGLDALDQNDLEAAHQYFKEALKQDSQFDMARDRMIPMSLWDATHNTNLTRVESDVADHIRRLPTGEIQLAEEPTIQVNQRTRLQMMGLYQDAGILPGSETRKAFIEAEIGSMLVFPELGTPPLPPGSN